MSDLGMSILVRLAQRERAERRHIRLLRKRPETPLRNMLLQAAKDRADTHAVTLGIAKDTYYGEERRPWQHETLVRSVEALEAEFRVTRT